MAHRIDRPPERRIHQIAIAKQHQRDTRPRNDVHREWRGRNRDRRNAGQADIAASKIAALADRNFDDRTQYKGRDRKRQRRQPRDDPGRRIGDDGGHYNGQQQAEITRDAVMGRDDGGAEASDRRERPGCDREDPGLSVAPSYREREQREDRKQDRIVDPERVAHDQRRYHRNDYDQQHGRTLGVGDEVFHARPPATVARLIRPVDRTRKVKANGTAVAHAP